MKLKCSCCGYEVDKCDMCGKKFKHNSKVICSGEHFCSYECEEQYQGGGEEARAIKVKEKKCHKQDEQKAHRLQTL